MKVLLVTHAKTLNRPPKRLSMRGRIEIEQVVDMLVGELGDGYRINKAVSSSAVRCLETAIACVDELGSDGLKRVETDGRLKRLDSPDKLDGVIRDNSEEGLAVFCHADLGGVLPGSDRVRGVRDGWFEYKPVMVILEWEPDRAWEENTTLAVKVVPEETSLLAGDD